MHRHALLSALTLITGCTFNVELDVLETRATYDGEVATLRTSAEPFDAFLIVGSDREGAQATATIETLSGVGNDEIALQTVDSSIALSFGDAGDGVVDLIARELEPDGDTRLALIEASVPTTAAITVVVDDVNVVVGQMSAPITIAAARGDIYAQTIDAVSILLNDGNVTALADTVDVSLQDGNAIVDADGWARLSTQDGNVDAFLGGGGEIFVGDGNVEITVADNDFGVLDIVVEDGNVCLHLPPGGGVRLELTTRSGNIDLDANGAEFQGSDTSLATAGGDDLPLIRINVGDGNIDILD